MASGSASDPSEAEPEEGVSAKDLQEGQMLLCGVLTYGPCGVLGPPHPDASYWIP